MARKKKVIPLDCNECEKKPSCTKLCDRAEVYANQDWQEKSSHEILMSDLLPEELATI